MSLLLIQTADPPGFAAIWNQCGQVGPNKLYPEVLVMYVSFSWSHGTLMLILIHWDLVAPELSQRTFIVLASRTEGNYRSYELQ